MTTTNDSPEPNYETLAQISQLIAEGPSSVEQAVAIFNESDPLTQLAIWESATHAGPHYLNAIHPFIGWRIVEIAQRKNVSNEDHERIMAWIKKLGAEREAHRQKLREYEERLAKYT